MPYQASFHILNLDRLSVEVERLLQLLKDSSYKVTHTADSMEAFRFCLSDSPDLIIVNVDERERENIAFFRKVRSHFSARSIPIIMTTEATDHRKRIEYMEMGADDLVLKPYYPEEVVARVGNIVQDYKSPVLVAKTVDRGFAGNLGEMDLIDLIQTMELGGKSGVIHLNRGDKEGQVFIYKGKIVDAVVEDYNSVERAFLHMLTWINGSFYVIFQDVPVSTPFTDNNQKLFDEATKIIDQWRKVTGDLPSLHTHLVAVSDKSAHSLGYQEKQMLAAFKEPCTILQAIDYSEYDDIEGLKIIKSLLERGLLIEQEVSYGEEKNKAGLTRLNGIGSRRFKNKYSHIFAIFQRNKKERDELAPSRIAVVDNAAENQQIIAPRNKIHSRIRLTKAELLLIRQKLGA